MSELNPSSLHRLSNNKNDWDNAPDSQLSWLQKIAKKTGGILTLGNSITLAGSVFVINGLFNYASGQKALGTAEVIGGRMCDLADGVVADVTKTKGKIGRDFDAGVDGVQLLIGLVVLENSGAIPLVPAIIAAAPKIVDTAGTLAAKLRNIEINPTQEGKYGAFALWGGIGAFMLRGVIDKHAPGLVDTGLEALGWTGVVGGTIYKLPATKDYLEIGFSSNTNAIVDSE